MQFTGYTDCWYTNLTNLETTKHNVKWNKQKNWKNKKVKIKQTKPLHPKDQLRVCHQHNDFNEKIRSKFIDYKDYSPNTNLDDKKIKRPYKNKDHMACLGCYEVRAMGSYVYFVYHIAKCIKDHREDYIDDDDDDDARWKKNPYNTVLKTNCGPPTLVMKILYVVYCIMYNV